MKRHAAVLTLALLLAAGTLLAQQPQTQPWRATPGGSGPAVGPNQPVGPNYPQVQRRTPPPQAPFQLSSQQQAYLDRVLNVWQQRSQDVKTFDCSFYRWEYDPVFHSAQQPAHVDWGKIKYAAPDKGMFRLAKTQRGREMVDIEPDRAEHWICDGKSVFEHNYVTKRLIEHQLPPELQGKAIEDGPLPFLFGANATKLKQRYFLRVITPQNVQDQVWLEAYPRYQQDAANFSRAELILRAKDMSPFGLQVYGPNGKSRMVYQFEDIVVNDPLRILKGNPFAPSVSTFSGWQKVVEPAPTRQAARPPAEGARQ